jgi:YidC/Oxa1 family membrane protein insertase
VFDAIATVLDFFYDLWPSYGMAIVFLTLAVMVILTPLTLKGTRSMMAMQRLQPEMKKIQQKHKGDRQKLNEEMLKFYQENKINPLGGCLPLLLQMPVFLVLYRVLTGLTKRGEDGNFNPGYLSEDSALRKALEGTDEMMSWGVDLSESASKALGDSFVHGIPYLILIGLVGATGWYQQRQTMARRTPGVEVNAQQQAIMKFMPILLPVISFSIPAGVVVYFLVSNLYRVGQQAYIQRTMHGPATEPGTEPAKPKGPKPTPQPATEARVVSEGPTRTAPAGGRPAGQRPRKKKKKR